MNHGLVHVIPPYVTEEQSKGFDRDAGYVMTQISLQSIELNAMPHFLMNASHIRHTVRGPHHEASKPHGRCGTCKGTTQHPTDS